MDDFIIFLYGISGEDFNVVFYFFFLPYVQIKFSIQKNYFDKMYGLEFSDKLPKHKVKQRSTKIVAFYSLLEMDS